MKTIYEWLNELPQPYKSQALYNFEAFMHRGNRQYLKTNTYDYMCQAINSAMHWEGTPQGHEYWNRIHNEYEQIKRRDELEEEERQERERREQIQKMMDRKVTYSTSMLTMLRQLEDSSEVARRLTSMFYWDNSFANYVTMRGDMCSYLPNGREHRVNEETGRWLRDGRQDMKPAKLARRLITDEGLKDLSDTDFEKFNNLVRAYISVEGDEDGLGKNVTLKVISGDDIKDAYYERNYSKIQGTSSNLWNSCMRYESCQDYFKIYTENPDRISMLVALDSEGKILGRALLWKFNNDTNGMDTIYASDSIRELFINWAIDNKYYYKASQSCHHGSFDMYEGRFIDDNGKYVNLTKSDFRYFPYMDTMQFLCPNGVLSNSSNSGYTMTLRCTSGGYEEDENGTVIDIHGDRIDEDDARYLEYRSPNHGYIDGYVHYDCTTYCQDGNYYLDEDCIEVRGRYYFMNDDDVVLLHDGDYGLRDNCVLLDEGDNAGEWALDEDCVQLACGGWALLDESRMCCVTEEYYLTDNMEEMENGDWVAIDNKEQYLEQLKENANA